MTDNEKVVDAINLYQTKGGFHPLTCGNNSNHTELVAKEQDGKVILFCTDCDYVQTYIPSYFTGGE